MGWQWTPVLTPALLAVETGNAHAFLRTCSEGGGSELREDAEAPPRTECKGALMQESTGPLHARSESPALHWASDLAL